MVSARSIFYGVNSSSALIKLAFIPASWLLLVSPFILLLARLFKVDLSPLSFILEDWRSLETVPPVLISLVAIGLSTRSISSRASASSAADGKARRVPVVPYWVPWSRHLSQFVLSDKGFLQSARDSSLGSIFAYKLAGTTHHVLLSPSLPKAVAAKLGSVSDAETDAWDIPQYALGMPKHAKAQYLEARQGIKDAFSAELVDIKKRKELVKESVGLLQDTLPDLLTFNSSIVDQMPWERVSDLDLLENMEDTVEMNLLSLINEFLSPVLLNPITGSTFPESNQLLFVDLSTFSSYFFALATGLSRFFPFPGLTPAHLSRNRLLASLSTLHESLTSASTSTEADAETPTLISQVNTVMSTQDLPLGARAAATLGFLNQLVSSAIPLAFWAILRIHAQDSSTLIPELLAETKEYAKATLLPPLHPSFPSATNIAFSTSVSTKCPLLTSCVLETLRVYAAPCSSKAVTQDLEISEAKEDVVGGASPRTWLLKKGDIIDIGASTWLRNTDARLHLFPKTWKPDRFTNSSVTLDESIESLVGGEEAMRLAVELVMVFVAGFVQLWELEPKGGKEKKWKIPGVKAGSVMSLPSGDIRVRIKKREIDVLK